MSASPPRAMVLAAGLGTRLAPLTEERPKALCPVGDRPQIDHVLARLAAAGVPGAVVNTHHRAEAFDATWRSRQPLPVELSHEPAILGTAGGVRRAEALVGEGEVLVWNADILADLDVGALVGAHRTAGADATLVVSAAASRGTVAVDASGAVRRLRHVDLGGGVAADYLGIVVLSASTRRALPPEGCLVGDVFVPALEAGRRLSTFRHAGSFVDTGSLAAYLEANLAWLDGRSAFVADTASVAPEVTLDRVVVGAAGRVAGRGAVRDCVVWPGASARAPIARAIVTPRGVVAVGP